MRKVILINLTDHPVDIWVNLGMPGRYQIVTIPVSGFLAKAKTHTEVEEQVEFNGQRVNLTHTTYEYPEPLPPPQPNCLYIVSKIIAQQLSSTRDDLRIPNGIVRDDAGRIVGCRSLGRV